MDNQLNSKKGKKQTPLERKRHLDVKYQEEKAFIDQQAYLQMHLADYVKKTFTYKEGEALKETIAHLQQEKERLTHVLNDPTISPDLLPTYHAQRDKINQDLLHNTLLLEYAYIEPSEKELYALKYEIDEFFEELGTIPELVIKPFLLPKPYWRRPLQLRDVLPLVRTNNFACRQGEIAFPVFNGQDELPKATMIPSWDLYELSYHKVETPKPPYGTIKIQYELGIFQRLRDEMRFAKAKTDRTNRKEYTFMYVWGRTVQDIDSFTGEDITYTVDTWIPIVEKNKEDQALFAARVQDHANKVEKMNVFSLHISHFLHTFHQQMTSALNKRFVKARIEAFRNLLRCIDLTHTYVKILNFKGLLSKKEAEAIARLHESRRKYAIEMLHFLETQKQEGDVEIPPKLEVSSEAELKYTKNEDVLKRLGDEKGKNYGASIMIWVDDNIRKMINVRPEKVNISSEISDDKKAVVQGTFGADDTDRIVYRTLFEVERMRNLSEESRKESEEEAILNAQLRYWREYEKEKQQQKRTE